MWHHPPPGAPPAHSQPSFLFSGKFFHSAVRKIFSFLRVRKFSGTLWNKDRSFSVACGGRVHCATRGVH
jgi:hypothetical protein